MYKKASAPEEPSASAAASGNGNEEEKTDEKVVDAEYEEVDKDKK